MSKIRDGRAAARACAAADSAQATDPRNDRELNGVWRSTRSLRSKSRSPTSVGDWIVTSVLIVKAEDFKIVNQPRESKSG
jgi:hypothetical protein